MATRGVHLVAESHAQPSFFEIVSHESLASVVEPAFVKILDFAAQSNPQKYGWILEWSDEIYAAFNGVLQAFYLKKYSASFSETFYSLKRVPLSKSGVGGTDLARWQRILSFVFLVVLPYVNKKLEKLEERVALDTSRPSSAMPNLRDARDVLAKGNRACRMAGEALVMCHYVLYISGRSRYPTLTLRLLRATLARSHEHEVLTIGQLLKKLPTGAFSMADLYRLLKLSLMGSLEVGAFLVQFARWNHDSYGKSFTALPKPAPPPIPPSAVKYKGLCPICYKTYQNPTTLVTSGYVFCYQCILGEIQKYGKCPVTNYPGREDDLVRLYTQT